MTGIALILISLVFGMFLVMFLNLEGRVSKLESSNVQIDESDNSEESTIIMSQVDSKDCTQIIR